MIRQYEHGLMGMTYILGSVCSDGVMLIGDRKVTLGDGATHEYEDKLFSDTPWMVVGSSGILGLFEKFRERLMAYLATPAYDNMVPTLTTQIELITRELNSTYREALQGQVFDVLLGVKSSTGAVLRYIHPFGFAEGVRKYKVIGHGEPYGSFFLKHWWQPNMKMLEVAEMGCFIIKHIQEFELDNTVGIGEGRPQVWLIPNEPTSTGVTSQQQLLTPRIPPAVEIDAMVDRASKKLANFKQIPWGDLNTESM